MINQIHFNNINNSQPIKPPTQDKKELNTIQSTPLKEMTMSNNFYMPKINFSGKIDEEAMQTKQALKSEIKKELDNLIIEIETPKGEKVEGTIKDYIQSCLIKIKENDSYYNMLHGTSAEARKSILKNGFDPEKISRTVCGPGTCFTGSEYEAHQIGGGAIIKCQYEGTTAMFQHGFYEKLKYNPDIKNKISEITGIKIGQPTYSQTYYNKLAKLDSHIGEYVRDIIAKDMGIDAVYDCGRPPSIPGCFVVYNLDSLRDISAYN